VPAPLPALRPAASQHAHRPAAAARPQTEFIAETAATAASSPTTGSAPSGAGGTEFGLESP
jgi:hypothetical protein